MLKYRVDSLDSVDAAHRAFYIADRAGGYRLDVEGVVDPAVAMRELEEARAAHCATKAQIRELREQLSAQESASAAAEAAQEARLADEVRKYQELKLAELAALKVDHARILVEHEARIILADLAAHDYHALLMPHVIQRLAVDNGALVVKGADGNASTVDQLKASFRADPAFQSVIRGASAADHEAQARRVAAARGDPVAAGPNTVTRSTFDRMPAARQTKHMREGGQVVDDETVH